MKMYFLIAVMVSLNANSFAATLYQCRQGDDLGEVEFTLKPVRRANHLNWIYSDLTQTGVSGEITKNHRIGVNHQTWMAHSGMVGSNSGRRGLKKLTIYIEQKDFLGLTFKVEKNKKIYTCSTRF